MAYDCNVLGEDLIAYTDGVLQWEPLQHIRTCPHCQRRLSEYAEVDRLLRENLPVTDDPVGRAAIVSRLKREMRE